MAEYEVCGCRCVSNAKVYGLDESIKRAIIIVLVYYILNNYPPNGGRGGYA